SPSVDYRYIEILGGYSQTLDTLIFSEETLTQEQMTTISKSLGNAILWVHQQNVVHLDIRASSFVLDANDRHWKMTNFGHACMIGEVIEAIDPTYAAPEILRAKVDSVDICASSGLDCWSLGALLYELFCRRPLIPPDTATLEQLLEVRSAIN